MAFTSKAMFIAPSSYIYWSGNSFYNGDMVEVKYYDENCTARVIQGVLGGTPRTSNGKYFHIKNKAYKIYELKSGEAFNDRVGVSDSQIDRVVVNLTGDRINILDLVYIKLIKRKDDFDIEDYMKEVCIRDFGYNLPMCSWC